MLTPTLATIWDLGLQARMSLLTSKARSALDRSLSSHNHSLWYSNMISCIRIHGRCHSRSSSRRCRWSLSHQLKRRNNSKLLPRRNYQRANRVRKKIKHKWRREIPLSWALHWTTKSLRKDLPSPALNWIIARVSKAEKRRNLRYLVGRMAKKRVRRRRSKRELRIKSSSLLNSSASLSLRSLRVNLIALSSTKLPARHPLQPAILSPTTLRRNVTQSSTRHSTWTASRWRTLFRQSTLSRNRTRRSWSSSTQLPSSRKASTPRITLC